MTTATAPSNPQSHPDRVKTAVARFTAAAALIRQIKRAEDALAYMTIAGKRAQQ